MLKLRRATVLEAGSADGPEQELTVELDDGSRRRAIADVGLLGPSEVGDELVVNVQALDLRLGSGGFDVVHVNLSKGLRGEGTPGGRVMKLNYTSLQHAVRPVEEGAQDLDLPLGQPAAILALHGQLAPVAWAFGLAAPGRRLGYVQTPGGALSGGRSRVVRTLRERGLLAGHLTAGAAYGGEGEAITTAGALYHGVRRLGWDAAVCGPGPGIVGSASPLGHGGMQALESAHTALALNAYTLIVPRMSSADPRPRHRGMSHHTFIVLELAREEAVVALPAEIGSFAGADLRVDRESLLDAAARRTTFKGELEEERRERFERHDWRSAPVDLPGYEASGLPAETMGRSLAEDPLFFAAALAGGGVLAELVAEMDGVKARKLGQRNSRMH